MANLFTSPPRLPLIAPSILSADFAKLGEDCRDVLEAGGDLLHVDVMDGHFVPNLTMGPALVKSLRAALPGVFLDVHLMVTDPRQYIEPFASAGANHLTFHVEPVLDRQSGTGLSPLSQGYDPRALADRCRGAGMTAGLAINPPTPIATVFDLISAFDLILVMSVNPGFSGQAFIEPALAKAREVRARLRTNQRLEMDGGIGPDNSMAVRAAGCDVIVAATAIFGRPPADWRAAIRQIRGNT